MTDTPKKTKENNRLGRGLSSLLGELPIAPAAGASASPEGGAAPASPSQSPASGPVRVQVRHLPIEWKNRCMGYFIGGGGGTPLFFIGLAS